MPPPVGGGCMGGLVDGWGHVNLDLIEIIQFCLKICNFIRHPHLWVVDVRVHG